MTTKRMTGDIESNESINLFYIKDIYIYIHILYIYLFRLLHNALDIHIPYDTVATRT